MPIDNDQVIDIFNKAITLPSVKRQSFIESACDKDQELLEELQRLLAYYEIQPDNYSNFVIHTEEQNCEIGDVVGPYEITDKVGHGGMADVFLARRNDGVYDGIVALKVIRSSLKSETSILRFEQERQLQHSLNHPNIAKLLDGGTTHNGLPYYVLDFIDGKNLINYSFENKLNIKERLILFIKVCDAVAHAHQKLIIHRDIKPTNILVTKEGEPKLLDFGIASLLNDEESSQDNNRGPDPMTPRYASPEQILGHSITTTSDVYSLGILLFELLTGNNPYPYKKSQAIIDNISEVILPKMSFSSKLRNRKERKILSGDLDAIVAKAIEKDTSKRYQSASDLREDIKRYLQNKIVEANKNTWLTYLFKFIQRNKRPTLVLSAIAILAISVGTTQQIRIIKERDTATIERDRLIQTKEFLIGLFNNSNPTKVQGEALSTTEIVFKGTKEIHDTLNDQPEIKSELLTTLGIIHKELGLYDESLPLLNEAVQLRRNTFSQNPIDLAKSLIALGNSFELKGELDSAEKSYFEAKTIYLENLGPKDKGVASSNQNLSNILYIQGKYEESLELLESALSIFESIDNRNTNTVYTLNSMSNVYFEMGHIDLAAEQLNRALDIQIDEKRELHPLTATIHNNLGNIFLAKKDYSKAETEYNKSLKIKNKIFEPGHSSNTNTYNNIGLINLYQSNYTNAISNFNYALNINEKIFGEKHISSTKFINNLALAQLELGKYEEAQKLLEQVLSIQTNYYTGSHPDIATTYRNLGNALTNSGEAELAIPYYEEALSIYWDYYDPKHSRIAYMYNVLGHAHIQINNIEIGLEHYDKAFEIKMELYGADHSGFAIDFGNMGEAYYFGKDFNKAIEYSNKSIELHKKYGTDNHPYVAYPYFTLGDIYAEIENYDLSRKNYQLSLNIRLEKLGADHPETIKTLNKLKMLDGI